MRRFRVFLYTAVLLLALGGQGLGGILPQKPLNWGGPQFLELAQSQLNGKLAAREISGNPLTGLTYKDVVLTGPQGQVLLRADQLELRLSAQSLTRLHPVVARLALVNPRLHLIQEEGRWNFSPLAPSQAPGPSEPWE